MQPITLDRRSAALSYAAAFAFIIAMTAVAQLLNDREIILPEIAAMAVALWAWRDQAWMRRPEAIFLWPSLTALGGFAVNLLAVPFTAKLAILLVGMLGLFLIFRYSLPPALATGFLPIVTNAVELSFLISISVTTLVLMLGVIMFRLRTPAERSAPLNRSAMTAYLLISGAGIVLAAVAGYPQLGLIPPVTVVVYESLHMKMYSARMALKQTAVLTLSAVIGAVLFQALHSWPLIAALDMAAVFLLLRLFKMRMPAAYAFPLLPFVFPPEVAPLLPAAALAACVVSFSLTLAYHHARRHRVANSA
ncbi:hypothetical protein [Brevundimonas sp.]|uniref:hypothetical protein n=1 Tax=Brevundimonas sp. TaxID=1871086 RepID=UPI0028A7E78C|nr:hypothetical protein [Brevundimonas sp.]